MDEDNPEVVDVDFDFRKVKQDKDNKTNLDPKNLGVRRHLPASVLLQQGVWHLRL